jgi:guanylate kinase
MGMSRPPEMSNEDRLKALQKSKESRQLRAKYKSLIGSGQLSFGDFLLIADSERTLQRMRVRDLLESVPGYGKVRVENLMRKSEISPTRRVQGLGKKQRSALLEHFRIPSLAKRGSLLVLSGPGGVGKSTVAKALRDVPGFWVSVSATTRSPRFNEVEGEDYFFYSNEEFDKAIRDGLFLEWAEFAGNRYGTPTAAVEEARDRGLHVLLEIELAGAEIVRSKAPEAKLIFLEPPSWEELVARLEARGTDSAERRAARLALAQEELAAASLFDTVIINERVEDVLRSLISLASS